MGQFDTFPSVPGALRKESLDITLKFERLSPTAGRVMWNIPMPSVGCSADTQAYCGIVIVIDNVPATPEKSPINGKYYIGDPTVDRNLHAGDTLDTALIVGAFYEDRTTVSVDVSGLLSNTPYYVSGYPVDCQGRYFQEGVHAYSLNYDTQHKTDDKPATQTITPTTPNITESSPTNLIDGALYTAGIYVNDVLHTLTINGHEAQTYQQLVDEITHQFSFVGNPFQSHVPPNTGQFYWNGQALFQWNGSQHVAVPAFIQATDPTVPLVGALWYRPSLNSLYQWDGAAWVPKGFIDYQFDVTQLGEGHFWFDGSTGYYWNGTTWCELVTYVSATDPSLPPTLPHGTYWYNTDTDILYRWDSKYSVWREATAIVWGSDPHNVVDQQYWFNDATNRLYRWSAAFVDWVEMSNVRIVETEPQTPAPDTFWYHPIDQTLKQWNATTELWVDLDFIQWDSDPTVEESCNLWWNTSNDNLYAWDSVHSQWDQVVDFIQSSVNPALPPALNVNDIWYNTTTGEVRRWENRWASTNYIVNATDPTIVNVGDVWYDKQNWYQWNGTQWLPISPTISEVNPYSPALGALWFNTSTNVLSVWNGILWSPVLYSSTPLDPPIDTLWYDTVNEQLMRWNGSQWVESEPIATATLVDGKIVLTTSATGSTASIGVDPSADPSVQGTLWRALDPSGAPPSFGDPVIGTDGNTGVPSYMELGVGTDGTPDQRLKLADEIRMLLGYPTIEVELTKAQIDQCMQTALDRFRVASGTAYKSGIIFLQLKAGEQHYNLTNKTKGFNKIVNVMAAHRLTSSFVSTAHGAGVYGQIVLQHLYNMGTFDLLSYHIVSEYTELMEILFAARLTFNWTEQTRRLSIYHRFTRDEIVALEVSVERSEQDIISDRWSKNWIQRYALAQARLMLAEIRGKYQQLNGPGVGVSFNASDLAQRAADDMEKLQAELDDYIANSIDEYGLGAQFVIG
jgi:hypothetical protein